MLKEIKTTVVFKDTKRAKKKTTGVFQDIHESKDYKQLLLYRTLLNQRAAKASCIPGY